MTRTCNIIDPTFGFATKGEHQTFKEFCDESGCIKCRAAKISRWSSSGPEYECGFYEIIAGGSDSYVTGMVTFCFNESLEYWQMWRERSTYLANLFTTKCDLRADCVAYS
jgi:hypothetical protein